jgi:hypothetical protein
VWLYESVDSSVPKELQVESPRAKAITKKRLCEIKLLLLGWSDYIKSYANNNLAQMLSLVPGHFRGILYNKNSSASYLHVN